MALNVQCIRGRELPHFVFAVSETWTSDRQKVTGLQPRTLSGIFAAVWPTLTSDSAVHGHQPSPASQQSLFPTFTIFAFQFSSSVPVSIISARSCNLWEGPLDELLI